MRFAATKPLPQIARAVLLATLMAPSAALCQQQGWTIGPFHRPVTTPIITPNAQSVFLDPLRHESVHWEALNTFNPAAVVRNGKVYVLYRAEDDSGPKVIGMHISRLGLATSDDGVHFTRSGAPVFYPADDAQKDREWPGGVEDPRVVEAPDGSYVLTYTQWNRKSTSIGVATSKDLVHWTKYGPVFPPSERAAFHSYKSSGIVTQLVDGRLIAAKIHGKFWMYWGEVEIHLATSPDLIHWTAIEDAKGDPLVLLKRRSDRFDSGFPEVGPPAVVTQNGIVLIYNGKNGAAHGAAGLDPGAYSVGEALFSADDPTKLLKYRRSRFQARAAVRAQWTVSDRNDIRRGTGLLQGQVVSLLWLCRLVRRCRRRRKACPAINGAVITTPGPPCASASDAAATEE